ncbi:ThuA domain-containing protein [Fontimonas sp. SYSU GA230001]|uniref:ThuA domain-containing protein n=1 Tax=Fontimonas sp. SYSU GA230001 TaxID=3142450 RepID=UPI0032B40D34
MLRTALTVLLLSLLAACGASRDDAPSPSPGPGSGGNEPFKVLVYSRTAGFRHPSIAIGIPVIEQLGADHGFTVDATEDPTAFTPQNLAQYAALVFLNTTLDVLDTEAQKTALQDYIAAGGGFVGIHSAADTFHGWPFYGELVGAQFLSHPVLNQPGTLAVEDTSHPSTSFLGADSWSLPLEEFYSFKTNPRGAVRVLLRIDESGYLQQPNTSCDPSGPTFPMGYSGRMGDHPMAWCHDRFAGRAWYTALGHEPYLYLTPDYQQHILSGILIAARRLEASCAVNAKPDGVPEYTPPELVGCETQVLP